ncbi:MAG: hypothetical protein WBV89_15980, partial [Ilumatobacter sp.]
EVGDDVITTSGIVGTITGEDGPTRFWLEIDDDVQVRIGRGHIQGKISLDAAADDDADGTTDDRSDNRPDGGAGTENQDDAADSKNSVDGD